MDNDVNGDIDQLKKCGLKSTAMIGSGSFGTVHAVNNPDGKVFATKILAIDDTGISGPTLNEINTMCMSHHPHIIRAVNVLTKHNTPAIHDVILVLPLADHCLNDIVNMMTYQQKLKTFYRIALAVRYMHRNKLLHLDLKTLNVVLCGSYKNCNPMLIDFGLSLSVDDVQTGRTYDHVCVSLDHRAPEILSGSRTYNGAVDIWSLGIMLLYMIRCSAIYNIDMNHETSEQIVYNEVNHMFNNNVRKSVLTSLVSGVPKTDVPKIVDLLDNMLAIDKYSRFTIDDVINHSLFATVSKVCSNDTTNLSIVHKLPRDTYNLQFREYLKLLVNLARDACANARVEVLFLAIDLLYRYYPRIPGTEDSVLHIVCTPAVLWIALKLIMEESYSDTNYIINCCPTEYNITHEKMCDAELSVLDCLQGQLYPRSLYDAATNAYHLTVFYDMIIDREKFSQYKSFDGPEIVKSIGLGPDTTDNGILYPQHKGLNIGEFFDLLA